MGSTRRCGVAQTLAACILGEHRLFWTVRAVDNDTALELLSAYVAERTRALQVREVFLP